MSTEPAPNASSPEDTTRPDDALSVIFARPDTKVGGPAGPSAHVLLLGAKTVLLDVACTGKHAGIAIPAGELRGSTHAGKPTGCCSPPGEVGNEYG
eukprot:scaffold265029_cov13-Tisochrysis_lutea.AAC.1